MRVQYFGITGEVDECGHCGKRGLQKAVMLFRLDADGNREELEYWGTTCAARVLGLRNAQVTRFAGEAERVRQFEIRRLECYLTGMDVMGRAPQQARRLWTEAARSGKAIAVAGVSYGKGCPNDLQFSAYVAAQVAVWSADLAILRGGSK